MKTMKLTAPLVITFWIAVILAAIGVLAALNVFHLASGYAFWLVVIGFIVLALGNLVKGI
jgi:hypothetical protein